MKSVGVAQSDTHTKRSPPEEETGSNPLPTKENVRCPPLAGETGGGKYIDKKRPERFPRKVSPKGFGVAPSETLAKTIYW